MKIAEYKKLNNPLAHCAVIIAVDAGRQTGMAIYDHEFEQWILRTESFWSAYDWIKAYAKHCTGIIIEVPTGHVIHNRVEGNAKGFGRDRQAANVGSARREAVLLADRFEALGFTVMRVKPTKTKLNAKEFAKRTGITERTNEHVRDAVMLVIDAMG